MAHIEWFEPESAIGENPFLYFDNHQEFIDFFKQDKNLIERKGGPGEAIQAGEWYLTPRAAEWKGYYLSYVRADQPKNTFNPNIFYWIIGGADPHPHPSYPFSSFGMAGGRDSWNPHTSHWKVDFDDILKMKSWSFMNWNDENPLEVKE